MRCHLTRVKESNCRLWNTINIWFSRATVSKLNTQIWLKHARCLCGWTTRGWATSTLKSVAPERLLSSSILIIALYMWTISAPWQGSRGTLGASPSVWKSQTVKLFRHSRSSLHRTHYTAQRETLIARWDGDQRPRRGENGQHKHLQRALQE